jgi:ABC-type uncharacterized transport system permease subunit
MIAETPMIPSIIVILRIGIALLYCAVSAGFIFKAIKKRNASSPLMFFAASAGIAAHAILLGLVLFSRGSFPLKTAFEGLAFSGLLFMAVSWLLVFFQKEENFAAFFFPAGTIVSTISMIFFNKGVPLPGALSQQPYVAHTWIVFGAYACFLLSVISSAMYLMLHREIRNRTLGVLYSRLPSLEIMDRVVLRADAIGAALMIIGIVMGFLWLNAPGFKPSNVHAKIALSMLAAVVYVCEHILRMGQGWEGKRACMASITGFFLIMATLLAGHHGF